MHENANTRVRYRSTFLLHFFALSNFAVKLMSAFPFAIPHLRLFRQFRGKKLTRYFYRLFDKFATLLYYRLIKFNSILCFNALSSPFRRTADYLYVETSLLLQPLLHVVLVSILAVPRPHIVWLPLFLPHLLCSPP